MTNEQIIALVRYCLSFPPDSAAGRAFCRTLSRATANEAAALATAYDLLKTGEHRMAFTMNKRGAARAERAAQVVRMLGADLEVTTDVRKDERAEGATHLFWASDPTKYLPLRIINGPRAAP